MTRHVYLATFIPLSEEAFREKTPFQIFCETNVSKFKLQFPGDAIVVNENTWYDPVSIGQTDDPVTASLRDAWNLLEGSVEHKLYVDYALTYNFKQEHDKKEFIKNGCDVPASKMIEFVVPNDSSFLSYEQNKGTIEKTEFVFQLENEESFDIRLFWKLFFNFLKVKPAKSVREYLYVDSKDELLNKSDEEIKDALLKAYDVMTGRNDDHLQKISEEFRKLKRISDCLFERIKELEEKIIKPHNL